MRRDPSFGGGPTSRRKSLEFMEGDVFLTTLRLFFIQTGSERIEPHSMLPLSCLESAVIKSDSINLQNQGGVPSDQKKKSGWCQQTAGSRQQAVLQDSAQASAYPCGAM